MPHRNLVLLGLGCTLCGCLWACGREPSPSPSAPQAAPVHRQPVRVAAAADLTAAFADVGRAFEQQSGERVSFSFGSTGLLAKQVREGAPFDVFAAANVSFVDEVVAAGACELTSKTAYARGRIAVWSKRAAAGGPATSLSGAGRYRGLAELADARFRRIAIANPEHAPYGKAAREALQEAGVWSKVEPRLVYGENVRQTLQLAESGNVEAAIVALALVVNDHDNPWFLIDERVHEPIDQALVVCKHGGNHDGGAAFARFVASEPGRAIMRRFGFLLPGEALTRAP